VGLNELTLLDGHSSSVRLKLLSFQPSQGFLDRPLASGFNRIFLCGKCPLQDKYQNYYGYKTAKTLQVNLCIWRVIHLATLSGVIRLAKNSHSDNVNKIIENPNNKSSNGAPATLVPIISPSEYITISLEVSHQFVNN
jgi:hypothetical protein